MNCELLSIIKPSEPLQCTRIERHSCYSVVTGCVVRQHKLKAILEMAYQIFVLQNSSEDPASPPSLDPGKMGLCCCSCRNLATVGGRERPGDVSVVLGYFPPPILGARILTSTGNPKNQKCIGSIMAGSPERIGHIEQRPNPTHVTLINPEKSNKI